MGKRYYCDYCDRSFADGAENRKKHLASLNHIKLRKAHYDSFKDAATILEENKAKNPCRKFHQTGYCEYELSCKYSHLTAAAIKQLDEMARAEQKVVKNRIEPDIDSWLQSKVLKMKETPSSMCHASDPALPPALLGIPNLPPSLKPPSLSDVVTAQNEQKPEWG